MIDIIYEYTNSSLTIIITRIDDDYQVEAFGESGRMMCLRLSEANAIKMANAIMDDVMGVMNK